MALRAILNTLDDAPEAVRDHYIEKDGKFVLNVEPVDGFALEDVNGLKTALGKERTTRERLERDVVKFKDIDPDKAREALAKLDELSSIDPSKEADKIANTKFEAAKAQLLEKHGTEIAGRDERIGKLTGAVDNLVRREAAVKAIAAAKGSVDLLLPHVLAHTKMRENDDGSFSVEVVDQAGNVRIGDSKGDPMSLDGLVSEMRKSDTFARAFDGDGHSGSGKKPDNGGGATRGSLSGDRKERAAYFSSKLGVPLS
ncbi:MAG: hypothetical protein ACK4RV_10240 [Caulobacter sp.]